MARLFQRLGEVIRGEDPTEGAQRRAAQKIIRQKERGAYYRAQIEEKTKLAQSRARLEREAQEVRLKKKYTPPSPRNVPGGTPFGRVNLLDGAGLTPRRPVARRSRSRRSRSRVRNRQNINYQPPQRYNPLGL